MATRTDDSGEDWDCEVDGADGARYADLRLEDGDVIIYDRAGEDAWIQSASAIGLELMR
ncbi:hypothetical protein [Salinigranum rubrum]|nr:hypothetical protein [Salinigranum rubrum]